MALEQARSVKLKSEQLNRQQLSAQGKAADIIFKDGIDLQTKFENGLLVDKDKLTWVHAISPTVTVIKNTNTEFQLKIQAINGTIISPNLKGATAEELAAQVQHAVEELDARVANLVDRTQLQRTVEALENNIRDVEGRFEEFENDVASLDSRVTTLHDQQEGSINAIQNTLATKADRSELNNVYTKAEADTKLALKLDKTVYDTNKPEEFASTEAFPETGVSGKIYIDTTDNMLYRWSGPEEGYVPISGNSIFDPITDDDIDTLF